MEKNVGNIDKTLRLTAAAVIALLYYFNILTGTLGVVMLVVAVVLVIVSIVGVCPIYSLLGVNTCKYKNKK